MPPQTRRALLASTGSLLAGLAGCAGGLDGDADPPRSPTTTRPTDTSPSTPPPSSTARTTTRPARLHVEQVDVGRREEPVAVFPAGLADWLRRSARTGEVVRGTGRTAAPGQPPALFAFDRIRLAADDPADAGTYRLAGSGGMVYDYLIGARPVPDPPTNATVHDAATLPAERRAFVRAAVDGRAEMDPSTRLGSWVRRQFLDGYVDLDGTVYTGYEIQQTDAAFFSETVYYDFRLAPVDGPLDAAASLALPRLDAQARRDLEPIVTREPRRYPVTVSMGAFAEEARSLTRRYDYLLTHATVFRLTVRE